MNTKVLLQEFISRDENLQHAPYDPEQEFYFAIKQGNVAKVDELTRKAFHDKKGLGRLSTNELQHFKYHFAITAALVARYCMEAGMEMAVAFNISDYYINKADRCTSVSKLSEMHRAMCMDYCKKMQQYSKKNIYSRPIVNAIDYIYDHLNERIKAKDISDYTKLSLSYISKLFKSETGETISEFILNRKLETAQNMLINSDYSISQIAMMLTFPSQSYFTEVFKKKYSITPNVYRNTIKPDSPFTR